MHRKGFTCMKKAFRLLWIGLLAVVGVAQGDHVPAYQHGPLAPGQAAPILPADPLWGESFSYSYQVRAYELAAKIPSVIDQLPCYGYCKRIGRTRPYSYFEGTHEAHCALCRKELFDAYEQTQLKQTSAWIRAGIVRREWKTVELEAEAKRDSRATGFSRAG
jgi:hypothetical protein